MPAETSQPAEKPLLQVENLSVVYSGQSDVTAVRDVSFSLRRGGSLGIVGESGCGKTTLGSALLRLLPPYASISRGAIRFDGVDLATCPPDQLRGIRWKRLSAIFQNAMTALNPVQRVGAQITSAIRFHTDADATTARQKSEHLFELVGIAPARLSSYPHQLSGGMRQRAVIALALCCDPDLVIADEPTTALDVVAQSQVLELLADLRERLGLTLIMVSHDLGAIKEVCDDIAVMYAGQLMEHGPGGDVLADPVHPYTRALVGAYPRLRGPLTDVVTVPGAPPVLDRPELADQCAFAERCGLAAAACTTHRPVAVPLPGSPGRVVACDNPAAVPVLIPEVAP